MLKCLPAQMCCCTDMLLHGLTAVTETVNGAWQRSCALLAQLTSTQQPSSCWFLCAGSLGLGVAVGHIVAKRMKITDLPQMVAAFHSLVRCCMAPVRLQRVLYFPAAGMFLPSPSQHLTCQCASKDTSL